MIRPILIRLSLLLPAFLLAALAAPAQATIARGCGDIEALAPPAGDEPVERWRYVDPEAGHYQVTSEEGGTLFAGSSFPGCAYGFSGFAALKAGTGDPIWQVTPDDLPGDVSNTIEQEGDRILFPLSAPEGPSLTARDAETGEEAWTVPGETGTPMPMGTAGDLLVTLESGNDTALLAALDLESGESAWSVGLEGYTPGALATDDAVYVTLRTGEFEVFEWETLALDPESGDELWTLPAESIATDVRAVDAGYAYAVAGDPILAAGALIALDPESGDEVWRTALDGEDLWPFHGIVADGLLLRGGLTGSFALALLDPETGEEIWRTNGPDADLGVSFTVVQYTDATAVIEWLDEVAGTVTLTAIDLETGDDLWTANPIDAGLGRSLTVSAETDLAYLTVDFGASSAVSALDLDEGALSWDIVYDDLDGPQILRVTDETRYLSASSGDETVLIALEPAGSSGS